MRGECGYVDYVRQEEKLLKQPPFSLIFLFGKRAGPRWLVGWEGGISDREVEMEGSWRGRSYGDEKYFIGELLGFAIDRTYHKYSLVLVE